VIHAGIDWFPEKALFEDYARFGRGHGHDLAEFDVYFRDDVRGLRWPVVNGKETVSTSSTTATRAKAAASTSTATP